MALPRRRSQQPAAGAYIVGGAAGVIDDIFNSPAGGLTEVAPSFLQAAAHRFDGCSRALADLFQRRTRAAGQVAENLWVVIHPADDRRDLVQATLSSATASTPLMPSETRRIDNVGADVELEQAENLGLQGDPGAEVLNLQVDLIDLRDRNMKQHIGLRSC